MFTEAMDQQKQGGHYFVEPPRARSASKEVMQGIPIGDPLDQGRRGPIQGATLLEKQASKTPCGL